MGVWVVLGIIDLVYLKSKNPKAIEEVATVHG